MATIRYVWNCWFSGWILSTRGSRKLRKSRFLKSLTLILLSHIMHAFCWLRLHIPKCARHRAVFDCLFLFFHGRYTDFLSVPRMLAISQPRTGGMITLNWAIPHLKSGEQQKYTFLILYFRLMQKHRKALCSVGSFSMKLSVLLVPSEVMKLKFSNG